MKETPTVNVARVEKLTRELLRAIGEDPDRPGLKDTPRRHAAFWKEFIEDRAGNNGTVFEPIETDQMVIVSGMKVWSLCEHHLLPFHAEIAVAYMPEQHILGLSKFARTAHRFAHRLQVQERLVQQIADEIERITHTKNVAVLATGEHLCMTMRGIKTPAQMTTSVLRGLFRHSPDARLEFLTLAYQGSSMAARAAHQYSQNTVR